MDFLRAPAMCELIERNLDYFCCGIIDPRNAAVIESNVSLGYSWHDSSNLSKQYHRSTMEVYRESC
jgi:hypothetical protein